MRKLSLIDQVMYKLESVGFSPIYMAGAMIVDPSDSPEPLDAQILADHIAACMEEIPLMRQKLVQDPLRLTDMKLVDDPDFNVQDHVTITTLKKPGSKAELTDYIGEFVARRMDLSRPLWEFEVVDGLEGGRFAVAMRLHHAILDGEGASQALAGLWSDHPVAARIPRQKPWKSNQPPGPIQLLRDAILETGERVYIKAPGFALKNAAPLVKKAINLLEKRGESSTEESGERMPKAQFTSLNVKLSDKRAISYAELPMSEAKALRASYQCTINDLVLALSSAALQHYFESISEPVGDLIGAMPLSLRSEGDEATGNKVTGALINLRNSSIEALDKRLLAIAENTADIKSKANRNRSGAVKKTESDAIDFGELGSLFSPLLVEAVLYSALKLNVLQKVPLINVAITNVPGSPIDQYMAGAKLVTSVPTGPCVDTVGLTICVTSMGGKLLIGFHGCGEAVKDAELFVEGVEMAFAELKRLAPGSKRKATAKKGGSRANAKSKAKAKTKARPKTKRTKT